jgi:hypothetical protein
MPSFMHACDQGIPAEINGPTIRPFAARQNGNSLTTLLLRGMHPFGKMATRGMLQPLLKALLAILLAVASFRHEYALGAFDVPAAGTTAPGAAASHHDAAAAAFGHRGFK